MFARFTFHKANFAASRLGSWISKAFNRKTKIKNPIALSLVLLIATLAITVFAVSASGWLAKPASTKNAGGENQTQPNPTAVRIETELVTIRPHGFEPQEITRKEGRFYIRVENVSGFREVNLRLDREAGARLRDSHLQKGKFNWKDVVDLTPGVYLLTVANNPEWVCRITVTPR